MGQVGTWVGTKLCMAQECPNVEVCTVAEELADNTSKSERLTARYYLESTCNSRKMLPAPAMHVNQGNQSDRKCVTLKL